MSSNAADARALRDAFGTFATGVTVITTRDAAGTDWGLTANSFSSVSLKPPLLSWCLGNASDCYAGFEEASHFAVHVLRADQEALSATFARKGADKFAGLALERGPAGIPLLSEYLARFVCRVAGRHPAGDHAIFLGEILDFQIGEGEPLLFHRGRYARLAAQ